MKHKKTIVFLKASAMAFLLTGVFFTGVNLYMTPVASATDWWDTDWGYCKLITINSSTYVDDDLVNFPMLVYRASDSDLAADALNTGDDIAFLSYDNSTQYNHEIEYFDGTTGEFYAWVNITSVDSTSDTKLWMYYGNAGASNQEDVEGTWNGNYLAVYHCNQSSGNMIDSTSNGYDLTASGTPAYEQTGHGVKYSIGFDGATDYFTHATFLDSFPSELTFETYCYLLDNDLATQYLWIKDNIDGQDRIGSWIGWTGTYGWAMWGETQNQGTDYVFTGADPATSVQYYISGSYEDSDRFHLTVNTTHLIDDTTLGVLQDGTSKDFVIGATLTPSAGYYWEGNLDEIRYSNVVRNNSWLNATYYSMVYPLLFHNFSAEVASPVTIFPIVVSDVYPAPGATDIETCPELRIHVTHLNGAKLNVTFFQWDHDDVGSRYLGSFERDYVNPVLDDSGVQCNKTYWVSWRGVEIDGWSEPLFALNYKYYWKVNITDGLGHSRTFPNVTYGEGMYYNFTTRSTNNTDNLTVYDNSAYTVGDVNYGFVNGTGWNLWVNLTGNPIGTNLSIINPNPGNGTHSTNYLRNDSGGLTTSLDVTYNNFTTPAATLPGSYSTTVTMTAFGSGENVQNISGVDYNTCRNHTNGQVVTGPLTCGQYENAGDFWVCRNFLAFNTSTIPDEATITSAHVALVVYQDDYIGPGFNITLQQAKAPVPHTPLISTDYWKGSFPSDVTKATMANKNISGYTDGSWFNMSLNASGVAWINESGFTYLVMRSDQDVLRDAPGAGVNEWIQFYATSGVTPGYNPRLVVNYTVPSSNWQHIVNLTWKSNSSGAWLQYAKSYVTGNGTVTVTNTNFSSNQSYFWNTSYESNGSNSGVTQVFTFTTVNGSGGASGSVVLNVNGNRYTWYFTVGSFGGLTLGMVLWRRKRRKDEEL